VRSEASVSSGVYVPIKIPLTGACRCLHFYHDADDPSTSCPLQCENLQMCGRRYCNLDGREILLFRRLPAT